MMTNYVADENKISRFAPVWLPASDQQKLCTQMKKGIFSLRYAILKNSHAHAVHFSHWMIKSCEG